MAGSASTFYWHDYETFGTDPARDRPSQFAGVRTDEALNIVGKPLSLYCKPASDFLPHPGACLVTGISPQKAYEEGVPECDFVARIHRELAQPGTCGVGYNSLRFDDEVTRHTLYRNFFDPYSREWQHGNSRWDIIDMVRTTYALRPDGIEWPLREDGLPSFRLEDLTRANGVIHDSAHDALSDVYATIAVAKLVRDRQPRLFDYVLTHRDKRSAMAQLDLDQMKPVLHVSGMFGAVRHNIALIVPLVMHPSNKNEVICFDLASDPQALFDLSVEELARLLYTRAEDLPEGTARLGIKSVHLNRCPVLLTARMADPATAARLGIEGETCRKHLAQLREHKANHLEGFVEKIRGIFKQRKFETVTDPDRMLYSGGFFSDNDKQSMEQLRELTPYDLAQTQFAFEDRRLPEMLFRYRARNYPDTLIDEERALWEEYRYARLTDPDYGASLCLEDFHAEIDARLSEAGIGEDDRRLLEQLQAWADRLLA